MAKLWTFVLSLADLAVFALLLTRFASDGPRVALLLLAFSMLAALAWALALLTAFRLAFASGRGWGWLLGLVLFLWVPVVPAPCFSMSGPRPSRFAVRISPLRRVTGLFRPAAPLAATAQGAIQA